MSANFLQIKKTSVYLRCITELVHSKKNNDMKTRIITIPVLAAMFIMVSCGPKASKFTVADEQPDGGNYTEKTVPVVTKVAPDGQVTLRFYDALPDVAYISAADFQSIVLPGSVMTVTHTGIGEYTLANGDAKAVVNVNNDVFVSDRFEAFTNQMGLLQPGMANVYYDGMPFVRFKDVTYTPSEATVTLDFAKYGIDIHADGKGTVYFPFATLADMYTDLFYHHAGFNGEKVVANTSVNEVSLAEIDPDYYEPLLAKKTRSESLANFNYKELCFAMDNFYGYPGRVQYNDALKTKGLDRTLEEDIACGPAIKKLILNQSGRLPFRNDRAYRSLFRRPHGDRTHVKRNRQQCRSVQRSVRRVSEGRRFEPGDLHDADGGDSSDDGNGPGRGFCLPAPPQVLW